VRLQNGGLLVFTGYLQALTLDRGRLASWRALAPRLPEVYRDRLGADLRAKPVLYLAWANRAAPGRSFQADVVPGPVVRFTPSGARWGNPSTESLAAFRAIEAHELAHVWNRSDTQTTPWVVEGGAEILSWAAMHAVGLIDDLALADLLDAAYEECAVLSGSDA
jgi:hypothetical protein